MSLLSKMLQQLALSLWAIVRLKVSFKETAAQFFEAGNKSIVFVTVTMGFIGMIGIYQTASQMAKVLPEYSALGGAFIQFMVREMGPAMTGLLLAARVGTGIAAELGSMKVTDQLDAMKLSSVDPVELLVAPRLIAAVAACICLATLGTVVAIITGCIVAYTGFSVLPDTFMSLRFVRVPDLQVGLAKCVIFGLTVPLVACACGFDARGGSEGVGTATTRAVVFGSFGVILLDAIISFSWEVLMK